MKKSERVNCIRNSLDSEEELLRRLPEIDAIYDEEVRACVIRTFLRACPDYFWERPSSSSGKYHSPDERGKHGNWLHTKRVFKEYANLSESYWEAHQISDYERECGKAAALLHDMMKYGWPSANNQHTVNNHDLIAADVARDIGGCPEGVVELIESHMGSWGEGPTPQNDRQWLLHFADKCASGTVEDDLAMYFPAEELLDEHPHLRVIEDFDEPI